MDKSVIKSLIIEKQREVQEAEITPRPLDLEQSANYVFIGLRRAGKTYLMYQHIQDLLKSGKRSPEDILCLNFEDERLSGIASSDLNTILDCYKELFDRKPLLFFDEIQNINGWEKFVRRLADSKYRVFVTGSNAKMLSKEIHTTLGGRFICKEVYPLSFREYLGFHKLTPAENWDVDGETRGRMVRLFGDYFQFGGFAESFFFKDKRDWLNSLYQKILLGDIVLRNGIRNENALRLMARKLAESVMQPMSLDRLKNLLDASRTPISRNTLSDYIRYFEDAYLIFGLPNYTAKFAEKETVQKRYFWDNGLLNLFLTDPSSRLLENLVALTLKKRYGDKLFHCRRPTSEVDFFIPSERFAVQASLSLSDPATKQRETKALLELANAFDVRRLELVTLDSEEEIRVDDRLVSIIPVWKWLLSDRS
jgi:predicted AAA+ superfamily ATPase